MSASASPNLSAFPDDMVITVKEQGEIGLIQFQDASGKLRTFRVKNLRLEDPKNRSTNPSDWKKINLSDERARDEIAQTVQELVNHLRHQEFRPGRTFTIYFTRTQNCHGFLRSTWSSLTKQPLETFRYEGFNVRTNDQTIAIDVESLQLPDEATKKAAGQALLQFAHTVTYGLDVHSKQKPQKKKTKPKHLQQLPAHFAGEEWRQKATTNQYTAGTRRGYNTDYSCTANAAAFVEAWMNVDDPNNYMPRAGNLDAMIATGQDRYVNARRSIHGRENPNATRTFHYHDIAAQFPNLERGRTSSIDPSQEAYEEALHRLYDHPAGVVMTYGLGPAPGSYAIVVNPDESVIFFDSHGDNGGEAYAIKFQDIHSAAQFLAQRFPERRQAGNRDPICAWTPLFKGGLPSASSSPALTPRSLSPQPLSQLPSPALSPPVASASPPPLVLPYASASSASAPPRSTNPWSAVQTAGFSQYNPTDPATRTRMVNGRPRVIEVSHTACTAIAAEFIDYRLSPEGSILAPEDLSRIITRGQAKYCDIMAAAMTAGQVQREFYLAGYEIAETLSFPELSAVRPYEHPPTNVSKRDFEQALNQMAVLSQTNGKSIGAILVHAGKSYAIVANQGRFILFDSHGSHLVPGAQDKAYALLFEDAERAALFLETLCPTSVAGIDIDSMNADDVVNLALRRTEFAITYLERNN